MPPTRVAIHSQTYPRCSSDFAAERTTVHRATSLPLGQPENSRLESLRSKKQKQSFLDVEESQGTSPSTLPTVVIARRRKRVSSPCTTPQADCAANISASVAEPLPDGSKPRPRKRHKRSLSTPAAPRSSQLSAQLQLRRRPRSRAGSPATDVEYVPPTRTSARLSRIRSLIDVRSPDIYSHLADPDGAGDLLREPPVASAVSSTLNKTADPQSVTRSSLRGRRRKVDLTDENAKKDLMEEWARMRQSQGALPLLGIDGNACFGQSQSDDNAKGTESISFMEESPSQPGSNSLDPETVTCQSTVTIGVSHSQETILEVALLGSSSIQIDVEDVLPGCADAPEKKTDDNDLVMPSDGVAEQRPVLPTLDKETPSTSIIVPQPGNETPTDRRSGGPETAPHPDPLPCREQSPPPPCSVSPSRENSVHVTHTEATGLPANDQEEAASPNNPPKDRHPATLLQTYPIDNCNDLDLDGEFYMLDVPEIFTLPWVPVSSHLYVPPGLGKLISGMRGQLMMEARARRRAEGLYQTELSRRLSAEKIIQDLRTELEERRKHALAERQSN